MHDHGWRGEYFLGEAAVHHLKPKERATLRNEQIGFVFQQYHLLDDLTVYENLDIPLSYRHYKKSERAAMVADMLDRFQIVGKKDLYPIATFRRTTAVGWRRARDHRRIRNFCWPMNRPEICTPARAKRSWTFSVS